jgi:ribosomal protein S18 acetylase RimI-like enzyme
VTRREPLAFEVRAARDGDEVAIFRVCRDGFALSSSGLLPPDVIEKPADHYYDVDRVRTELAPRPHDPSWQGYVVAVSRQGRLLGAAGGGVVDSDMGQLLVLYLDPSLRGRGIGTALLDHVTGQQRAAGATEQCVSVTEGNLLAIPFYRARGFVERGRVPYVTANGGVSVGTSLRMSRPVQPDSVPPRPARRATSRPWRAVRRPR